MAWKRQSDEYFDIILVKMERDSGPAWPPFQHIGTRCKRAGVQISWIGSFEHKFAGRIVRGIIEWSSLVSKIILIKKIIVWTIAICISPGVATKLKSIIESLIELRSEWKELRISMICQ